MSPVNIKIEPDIVHEDTTESKAIKQPKDSNEVENACVKQPVTSVVESSSVAQTSAVVKSKSMEQSVSSVAPSSSAAQTSTVSALPQNSGLNLLQNGLMMQPNTVVFVVPSNNPNQAPYQFIMPNAQNVNQLGSQAVGIIPMSNGTMPQMANGTIQQMANGTVQQLASGTIQQLANGTIQQMANGTIQQMANVTIQQMANGTIQQMANGTIQQMANGTIQQIANGTIQQMANGTIQQMTNGIIQQMANGTIQQMTNSTISQMTTQNLPITNGLIPQTAQSLSISNSFLSQTNQQNLQMATTSMLPQMSGSFLPQLTQNMQIPNGFLLQTTQQNIQIPNAVVPQGTQGASMSNNLLPQTSQQSIQMTNTILPQVTQNNIFSQAQQNMNVSNPVMPLLPQSCQQITSTQVPQSIPNNPTTQTVQKFQVSKPANPQKNVRKKNVKITSTTQPEVSQTAPNNPTSQTNPVSKFLKPLLPKTNQGKNLFQVTTSIPVSKNLLPQSNQQNIPTTSSLLPQVSPTLQQNIHGSNSLMPQVSQSLILPNNVLPLTSQQSFTLTSNLLPQTVQSNNLLPLTSQNISLTSNLLPQTVQSNNVLPLASQQSFTLAGNLIPQTVQSNNLLPLTSQNMSLTNNILPQAAQRNNVLPLSSQNISLTNNSSPQILQNLTNSSPQTIQKASDSLQKATKSVSRPKLLVEQSKTISTNTKKRPIAPKTPLDECEKNSNPTVSEIVLSKYLTRSAKREQDILNKKSEEKTLSKLAPILPAPTGESTTTLNQGSSDGGILSNNVAEQNATRWYKLVMDDEKLSVQTLGNTQVENNQETATIKKDLKDDSSNLQNNSTVDHVEQSVNGEVSTTLNQNINGPVIFTSSFEQLELLLPKPAERNANGLLECPKCRAEHLNEEHLEMHDHIYHNKNYPCICGKGFESMIGLKLHKLNCLLSSKSNDENAVTQESCIAVELDPQVVQDELVENCGDSLMDNDDSEVNRDVVEDDDEDCVEGGEDEEVKMVDEDEKRIDEDEKRIDEDERRIDKDEKRIDEGDGNLKTCPSCKMKVRYMEAHLLCCRLKPAAKYPCKICGKVFRRQYHLEIHMQVHIDKRAFSCKFCTKSFKTIRVLFIHMGKHARELAQGKTYKCDKCHLFFRLKSDLKTHTISHSDNIPVYNCDECNILFSSEKVLQTHMETHFSANPFKCELCDGEFNTKVKLTRHMYDHHNSDGTDATAAAASSNLTDISPKLDRAANLTDSKVFDNEFIKIDQSPKLDDKFETSLTNENTPVYKCKLCRCLFASESVVKTHLKTHFSKQLDDSCLDENFESSLSKQNLRVFKCKLCGCRFTSEKLVKTHIKTHFLKRAYTCNICGCTYDSNVKLKRHKMYHDESHLTMNTIYSKPDRVVEQSDKEPPKENMNEMLESDEMYIKIGSFTCADPTDEEPPKENTSLVPESEEFHIKIENSCSDTEQPEENITFLPEEEMNIKIESVESSACFPFSADFSSLDNHFDSEPDENALTPEVKLEETDDNINTDITEEKSVKSSSHSGKYCPKCRLPIRNLAVHSLRCPMKDSRLCKPCGKYFKNEAGYNIHVNKMHNQKICPKCRLPIRNLAVHSLRCPIQYFRLCKPCGRYFKNEAGYNIHVNKMHNQKISEFECEICPAKFRLISELNNHLRTHTKVPVFSCFLCGGSFSSEKVLDTHLNTHFVSKNPNSAIQVKNKPRICPKDSNFPCNICDKIFNSHNELVSHIKVHFSRKRPYNH